MSWRLSPSRPRRFRLFCLLLSLASAASADSQAIPSPRGDGAQGIDEAVRRGREALLPRLEPLVEEPRSDYPIGRMSFVLCALLESGVPIETPIVKRTLDRLARLKPTRTYCVACYLLALGALLDRLESERGAAVVAREPTSRDGPEDHGPAGETREEALLAEEVLTEQVLTEEAIRAKMADLSSWLVSARAKGRGTWTYEAAGRGSKHDFSNTQFAVLGLHVAMKHGITVPVEVFGEIIRVFSASIQLETEPTTLSYRPATTFEAVLGLEKPPAERRTRVRPGGWAYRATARAAAGQPAYPAMTAAGASSVIVALEALRRARGGQWRRITERGETTVHRAYAWIEKHFEEFVADGRNLYYTLYSLEKVGDLGGVASLGRHDWYVEGARRLLEKQRSNGSWGSYVDTAFALLFLTRATRSMGTAAAPTLLTRGDNGEAGEAERTDLVYVDSARGFLSARDLLRYMAKTRDPRLVEVGRSVVRNYDPRHREDLIPHLLELWEGPGRLRMFARQALKDITGESFTKSDEVRRWREAFLEIRSMEKSPAVDPSDLARRLRKVESPALKTRLVRLARRRELRSLAPVLIDELARAAPLRTSAAASYRRLVHGLLGLWTAGGIRMPADEDRRAWERTAEEWRKWVRRNTPPE